MILVYLSVGFVTAIIAAVTCIVLDKGFLAAALAYSLGGMAGIGAVGAFQFVRVKSAPFPAHAKGGQHR